MGFNCAQEKAKFDCQNQGYDLVEEYTQEAGMSLLAEENAVKYDYSLKKYAATMSCRMMHGDTESRHSAH